jgi:AcrR family transcriptional regulator
MGFCPSKYEIRTNQKKEAIITSAQKLFVQKGFSNTSIKEIAASAQVSQVSIYNYFGNKDALVLECIKSIVQDSLNKAYALLETDMPYLHKLDAALSLCSADLNASLLTYLSSNAIADHSFMTLLSDGVHELRNDLYLKYIETGKREGYIDASLPTSLILKFISAINSIEISSESYHEEMKALHQLVLHGILI